MKPFVKRFAAAAAVWLVIPGMALASTVTVQRGDSLWSIASKNHTTVSALESVNNLHSTTLHPNQVLQLPSGGSHNTVKASTVSTHTSSSSKHASTVSSSRYVTVSSGQTVWSIANEYGVSTSSILAANHLSSSSVLHIGQRLLLPSKVAGKLSGRSGGTDAALADATLGEAIAQYAMRFQGVPYRWGGTTPGGFDCSGFVLYVFGHFGISLGRTSYAQASEGVGANRSYPEIGDIVYFDTDGPGASHVGIYVGNGEFVNAEDRGVRIDSLTSGYWAYHYIGARHVR